MERDGVLAARLQRLWEIDEYGIELALVFQRRRSKQDALDRHVRVEVELDARVVFEHLEADAVDARDALSLRIDADVEMIEKQIVVGAIASVTAAQDVGARGRTQGHRLGRARGRR